MRVAILSIVFPWLLAAQGGGGTSTAGPINITGGMVTPGQPSRPPAQTYKPEELCSVDGVVRHAISGEPLRKANVTLMRTDPGSNNMSPPATTTTNAEGKFAMKGLEPGQYRVMAQRPGFVNSGFGGMIPGGRSVTALSLDKGQKLTGVEVKLTPHSVVTGRITDEDGDPVPMASVSLVRPRYFQGRKTMIPSGQALSNDLGEYRLFGVSPGRYYVSVSANRMNYGYGVDRSAARAPEETNAAATYYPSTTELQSATQVNVPLAGTVQGIDVRVRKERTFRVKGKITGFPAGARGGGMVGLVRRDGATEFIGMGRDNMTSWRSPSGEFELAGVRPGSYQLRAMHYEPDQQMSGTAAVEVTDSDVEGVNVMLGLGLEVTGLVRTEGEQPVDLEAINLYLESRTSRFAMMGNNSGRVKAGGVFQITRVMADQYTMRVMGLPPEYYVKSIRTSDRDVLESGLDLSSGAPAAGVEITISATAGQLEGSVADAKGNPLKGASVILRPKSGKQWELAMMQPASSDQYGKFRMQGIAPGEYQLLAFDSVDPMEAMDPDFWKDYESKAETVKLTASGKETRQLTAVAVEAR